MSDLLVRFKGEFECPLSDTCIYVAARMALGDGYHVFDVDVLSTVRDLMLAGY